MAVSFNICKQKIVNPECQKVSDKRYKVSNFFCEEAYDYNKVRKAFSTERSAL